MKTKTPADSYSEMTELVLPNDTNTLGNLMGGRLLHWMDIVSAIAASKHCNRVVVTVSVDFVDFKNPIRLGEIVILKAWVTQAFTTSMEIKIDVWSQNLQTSELKYCNSAFYTFVAVDQTGFPIPVNKLDPVTDEQKSEFDRALSRRELRLINIGKLKPEDATHVKKIFLP